MSPSTEIWDVFGQLKQFLIEAPLLTFPRNHYRPEKSADALSRFLLLFDAPVGDTQNQQAGVIACVRTPGEEAKSGDTLLKKQQCDPKLASIIHLLRTS